MAGLNVNRYAYTLFVVLTVIRSHDLMVSVEGAVWCQWTAKSDRQLIDL
jgi:hypothetical protein